MRDAVLAGRQLFSVVFIIASAGHFNPHTIESAARHGVPLPELLVPLSAVIALAGGLSVLLGFQTRVGAWLLRFIFDKTQRVAMPTPLLVQRLALPIVLLRA